MNDRLNQLDHPGQQLLFLVTPVMKPPMVKSPNVQRVLRAGQALRSLKYNESLENLKTLINHILSYLRLSNL